MKKIILLIFLIHFTTSCKRKINKEALKKELDSIYNVDQTFRYLLNSPTKNYKKFLKEQGYTLEEFQKKKWVIINKHDSLNQIKVESIIKKNGYPGKSLVGEPTNKAAWYVIQHSRKNIIEKHFTLIEKAGKQKEIPMTLVAMMQDRLLMYQKKEQIYGTQASGREIKNNKTGKIEWKYFIWPIKNPEKVNELRKAIGYKNTIEEYAQSMDIVYKKLTLDQVINQNHQ
ncbi:hypothetical protein OD91_2150 [Lutibacter sp. Hel_I_33_5]|uniref:DUF6624 domain-containing protein n=1 Tax=Lutibacter sp. Hel_I_33_5 TaxID=1566289 RepID=UPI0011A0F4C7|nr:DUF6624 domain-containing protein [Lutibacter sp. Hel_I_33_5]TVZ56849.1 hypothetical protein OD91_2150 [Lutibacter sp. Hel_I_33_5]